MPRRSKALYVVGKRGHYEIHPPIVHPPYCACDLCPKHREKRAIATGRPLREIWAEPLTIRIRRQSKTPSDAAETMRQALRTIDAEESALIAAARRTTRDPDMLTLGAAAEIYIEDHGAMMPESSRRRAEQVIAHARNVIVREGEGMTLADIPISILRGVDMRAYQRARQDEVAPGTVNREWNTLRAILNYAARNELVTRNPIAGGMVKPLQAAGARKVFFHPNEWRAFLGAFADPEQWKRYLAAEREDSEPRIVREVNFGRGSRRPDSDASGLRLDRLRELVPLFRAYLYTAARLDELLTLRWRDVDFRLGSVTIRQKKTAKTMAEKTLPMAGPFRADLEVRERGIGDALIYRRGDGRPFYAVEVQRAFKLAITISGGNPDLTVHSIRHTAASWATIAGFSEAHVAELLGHSRKSITNGYSHLARGSLGPVIRMLETIERDGYPEGVELEAKSK